jgi:hypothetical protein
MWTRAAVFIALGYLVPAAWLGRVIISPPPGLNREFGALRLLVPLYWVSWVTLVTCSIGLWIAVLDLRRVPTVLLLRHWVVLGAGAFGVLASGCIVGYAQT